MKAVIYSGDFVQGFHENPNIKEFDALGTQYDLLEEVPGIILNTPPGHIVKRIGEGQYELEALPPSSPKPEDRIAQLEGELLQTQLALAELVEANDRDKTEIQLALTEIAELVSGGA